MPFASAQGITVDLAGPDEVRGHLAWAQSQCTTNAILHGGALITLADSTGAICAYLHLPPHTETSTIQSSSNFLRAVRSGTVQATSRPLHVGRTTIVVQTQLRHPGGTMSISTRFAGRLPDRKRTTWPVDAERWPTASKFDRAPQVNALAVRARDIQVDAFPPGPRGVNRPQLRCMTSWVIDGARRTCLAGGMNEPRRYERSLRMIIWSDLFLSVAFVGTCVVGSPILAVFGVPDIARPVLAIGVFVCAVLLGGFGGVAALMMMARLRCGDMHVPAGQRYPLPVGMRPASREPGQKPITGQA